MVAPGEQVTKTASVAGTRPKWLQFTGANELAGTAQLPSGSRRAVRMASSTRYDETIKVDPVAIPTDSDCPWRCIIFAPNGDYLLMDGLAGFPTIGTPVVRLTSEGPSRAEVSLPLALGDSNVLASNFARWTGTYVGPVERGMEMTVEYRSSVLVPVFRGRIYQIQQGEAIKITAYDRIMDLAQYSDQYQSDQGYVDRAQSTSRTTSGSDYVYTLPSAVGVVSSCQATGSATIDALAQMNTSTSNRYEGQILHDMPKTTDGSGILRGPSRGSRITKLRTKVYINQSIDQAGTVKVALYLYRKINGEFYIREGAGNKSASGINITQTLEWDVDWLLDGDPSEYYIGAQYQYSGTSYYRSYGYAHSSTRYTTSEYYSATNLANWTPISASGELPEIAIEFTNTVDVTPSAVIVNGTTATIQQSAIPNWPPVDGGYIRMLTKGDVIVLSYFVTNSASLRQIVIDLLSWAGLVPDVPSEEIGTTTYYSTSTYDYLTCVLEIIRASNLGLAISHQDAGTAVVRPKHTIDETPANTYSTDPMDANLHTIVQHDITAHWMAEKATVAYLAEEVTSSGLPIALETDDALLDGSLVQTLQSPLRQVVTDRSLGTHSLQANTAGGRMVQLHTNVFEGSMVLAGYCPEVWDLFGSGSGGLPVGVVIPEAGVSGTAIPTEVILGDGMTRVVLDNIRTADRSEMANSMGLSADAISNSELPNAVFIFARAQTYALESGMALPSSVSAVSFYHSGSSSPAGRQTSPNYIKIVQDKAGYGHVCAILPKSTPGWSPNSPISAVSFTHPGGTVFAVLDNPKRVYDEQALHIDIRFKIA